MQLIEYRVRPVTRYIVTRFERDGRFAGGSGHGEFDNERTAYEVGYALCKAEHDRLGWAIDDERIRYPERGCATSGQGVRSKPKVTPAMIAAGSEAFWSYDVEEVGSPALVEAVFRAMCAELEQVPGG